MSQKTTFKAPAISCQHCAMTITRALANVQGIGEVEVNVPNKTITLAYADSQALARAKAVLEDIGYPVSG